MRYPKRLEPTSTERITFPSGREVDVPKTTPSFRPWQGRPPKDRYGNKPLLECDDELVFAELAILRLFEREGWEGRWIDSYRRKYRTGYWGPNVTKDLPAEQHAVLDSIRAKSGRRGGCFDVFCWGGGLAAFAEAKWTAHDRIRPSQRRWLEAALDVGIPLESFLIVEWTIRETTPTMAV